MSDLSSHSAPGQALGYFFQLERAMSWISKVPMGATVGIETDDDVVVKLVSGEKIHEQDKSSTSNFPFIPSRPDLWKTLQIWLEAIQTEEIDISLTLFYLVTNKYAENTLVEKIGNAKTEKEAKECLEEIKKAIAALEGENRKLADKTLTYSEELIIQLVQKINFEGGNKVLDHIQIISDLQIVEDDPEIVSSIINELKGWLFTNVVDRWRDKKPAIIERDAFIIQKNKLIKFKIEKVFNETIYKTGQLNSSIINEQLNSKYIKQLIKIQADEEAKIEAVTDYMNSIAKKTQLAKKGYISDVEIEKFEDDLKKRWKKIFENSKIIHKNLTPEEIGKLICNETLEHNGELGEVKTKHYFLTRGTYHHLSDQLKLGWHPEYKNLLKD